jgi:hypothetical protein
MSSWIVEKYHINALVTWAAANGVLHDGVPVKSNERAAAKLLYAANVAGVNNRYNENTGARIAFKKIPEAVNFTPAVIAKSCACLDYQSCDIDSWETSAAKRLVDQILAATVRTGYGTPAIVAAKLAEGVDLNDLARTLPSYGNAPWGLSKTTSKQFTQGN